VSLKAFHLFFIGVSVVLSTFVGIWGVQHYADVGDPWFLALSALGFLGGIGLSLYAPWFLKKFSRFGFLGLAVWLAVGSAPLSACPVCLGDPNSPLTLGANLGVLFLLGVVGLTLAGFAGLFLFWARRASRLTACT